MQATPQSLSRNPAAASELTAASLLAKEGLKVLVLERLERVGGCCSNYDVNGFRPEVGAVFVIGHEFYYKLFELLDLRLEDYLQWDLIDPVYHVYLGDGSDIALPRDLDEMAQVVKQMAPQDVDGYRRYCRDMEKNGYFGHFSPTPGRRTPFDRMKLQGYEYGASENCIMGQTSPLEAHEGWCRSSGHHRNLLMPAWTEMGTGAHGIYMTQNFGQAPRRGRLFSAAEED